MKEPAPALQIALWGYAIGGDADNLAWVCETGQDPPSGQQWWDRTAADLDRQPVSCGGEPDHRAPERHALPGVTALLRREEMAW